MKRLLLLALLLTGCARPINPAAGPLFNPMSFFTGHVTSWGIEEDRAGAPIAIVTTDCQGTATGPHSIRMVQTLHVGTHQPTTRIWQFTQTNQASFTGTANDMDGQAAGTAAGPVFHWRWTLETSPGNALKNVTMEQWMYRLPDGTVLIRTIVTKLGVRLIEVSEQFVKS